MKEKPNKKKMIRKNKKDMHIYFHALPFLQSDAHSASASEGACNSQMASQELSWNKSSLIHKRFT